MSKNKKERKVSETISEKIIKTELRINKLYIILIIIVVGSILFFNSNFLLFHNYIGGVNGIGFVYILSILFLISLLLGKHTQYFAMDIMDFSISYLFISLIVSILIVVSLKHFDSSLSNYNIVATSTNNQIDINNKYSQIDTKEGNTICYSLKLLNKNTNKEELKEIGYCIEKRNFSKETINKVLDKKDEFLENLRKGK